MSMASSINIPNKILLCLKFNTILIYKLELKKKSCLLLEHLKGTVCHF